MTISIRVLTEADFQTADVILGSAFQRVESWSSELRLFRRLQPEGVFLASQNGIPAGMVATVVYSHFAYVGLMAVHQDFQKQGLGRALMEHVLSWMDEQKVPLVKLDASQSGQPLYEKLGFVPLDQMYVYQRQAGSLDRVYSRGIQPLAPHHLDLVAAIDSQAFGANRGPLLRALLEIYPERGFILKGEQGQVDGYLIAQAKRIGPWVMDKNGDAEPLLKAALSLPYSGDISVITPASNSGAASLLKRYGFRVVRANRHMTYGPGAITGQREKVYGQTSISFG